ncbi:unnamed protein product [Ceratitis capitata]|uniref:(Mediterranean fruit fly) hypothetical protein n=1 Tax=Ceratitis capitata TaxID=7213 RepID=A0A811VA67_CERCA|nr:unnamed protein product [Ceratitis capitata]
MTNYRKHNEDLGEPLPKRSKPANFYASTTRLPIYEARRNGNRVWPQRERRWKPNKWTSKENTMTWTKGNTMPSKGNMMPNMNNSRYHINNNMLSQTSWLTQMPPSGGPPSTTHAPQATVLPPINNINIDGLFHKIVASGIVGPGGVIAPNNKAAGVLPSAAAPQTTQDKKTEEASAPHNPRETGRNGRH